MYSKFTVFRQQNPGEICPLLSTWTNFPQAKSIDNNLTVILERLAKQRVYGNILIILKNMHCCEIIQKKKSKSVIIQRYQEFRNSDRCMLNRNQRLYKRETESIFQKISRRVSFF